MPIDKIKEERDEGNKVTNPYFKDGKWYWYDEGYESSQPYETEAEAKNALNRFIDSL